MSNPKAIISTTFGDITIEFMPDVAPKHVENFLKLARAKFYDGTTFHRCIPGFMIQGGCPNTKQGQAKGPPGTGGPGWNVKAEFNKTNHARGVVSMARSADPDSAGCQFFICVDAADFLDNQYTAFGKVTSGMEAADKIVSQKRGANDMPFQRVEMTVKVVE